MPKLDWTLCFGIRSRKIEGIIKRREDKIEGYTEVDTIWSELLSCEQIPFLYLQYSNSVISTCIKHRSVPLACFLGFESEITR